VTTTARKLANVAIDVLCDRKGFDWWWDDLSSDIRHEIKRELGRELIAEVQRLKEAGDV